MQIQNVGYLPVQNFKGRFVHDDNKYLYNSTNPVKPAYISYDKESGNFEYQGKGLHISYDKQNSVETVFEKTEYGSRIETTSPVLHTIVKKDRNNSTIYFYRYNYTTKNSEKYEYDKRLNRKIFTIVKDGKQTIKVYDVDTRRFVDRGEKTWLEEIDKASGKRIYRNAVTNAVAQRENLNPKNHYLIEYDETTGKPAYKMVFNDKDTTALIEYGDNGDITKHAVFKAYDRSLSTICYIPGTKIIDIEIVDYKNEYGDEVQRVDIFDTDPSHNIREFSQTYNKMTKHTVERVKYDEDGKTPRIKVEYMYDGSEEKTKFDEHGIPTSIEIYDEQKNLTYCAHYVKNSNKKLAREVYINPVTRESTEYKYDESGFPTEYHIKDASGNLLESAAYCRGTDDINVKYEYRQNCCIRTRKDDYSGKDITEVVSLIKPATMKLPSYTDEFKELFMEEEYSY